MSDPRHDRLGVERRPELRQLRLARPVRRRTMARWIALTVLVAALASPALAQEEHHDHPAPERLGAVHFKTSCAPAVGAAFDRAVALLHSFAYEAADHGFAEVAARDPACAMAHW